MSIEPIAKLPAIHCWLLEITALSRAESPNPPMSQFRRNWPTWLPDPGCLLGHWIFRVGYWILNIWLLRWLLDILPPCGIPQGGTGYWILNKVSGFRFLAVKTWTLDIPCWILDIEYWSSGSSLILTSGFGHLRPSASSVDNSDFRLLFSNSILTTAINISLRWS